MAEEMQKGRMELLGYVSGGEGGVSLGGGVQYGLAPRFLVATEVGFLTAGNDANLVNVNHTSNGVEVNANLHYLFPMDSNEKLTPYVLGGVGVWHVGTKTTPTLGTGLSSSTTVAGVNFGGGLRYAVRPNWGIRPEVRFLVGNGHAARVGVSVYYQFK
jgi:opacity protein-like surface antigen